MSVSSIDNLSAVLYVPKIQTTTNSNQSSAVQRQSFNTTIAPSRSRELVQKATAQGQYIQSILQGLSNLAAIAEKTTLPSNYPDITRVNLQAELTKFIKSIDDIANSAEVGSISLLRGDSRSIYLKTKTRLDGNFKLIQEIYPGFPLIG